MGILDVLKVKIAQFHPMLLHLNLMDCGRQAPLSVGLPRQEYWNGLLFPSSRDLPGLNPGLLHCR